MAVPAAKVYEAMKRPPLKRYIDQFGKNLYRTDSDTFAVPESRDRP